MKLTKKQAIAAFLEIYTGPRGDTVWKRGSWNDYTDMLCKDRQITQRQYDTWTSPF